MYELNQVFLFIYLRISFAFILKLSAYNVTLKSRKVSTLVNV